MRKSKNPEQRTSIIGRIICIERRVVGEGPAPSQEEDFGLLPGTEYFVCDAEPLYKSSMTSGSCK